MEGVAVLLGVDALTLIVMIEPAHLIVCDMLHMQIMHPVIGDIHIGEPYGMIIQLPRLPPHRQPEDTPDLRDTQCIRWRHLLLQVKDLWSYRQVVIGRTPDQIILTHLQLTLTLTERTQQSHRHQSIR